MPLVQVQSIPISRKLIQKTGSFLQIFEGFDPSGTSWSSYSPFYDVAHLAQVTYADPETAAWQGRRGVHLRQM